MKKFFWMCFSLSLCAFSAVASEDFTKGVLLNSVPVQSTDLTMARLTELSSTAIEKGLKDTQLLAKPHWNERSRIMILNWHSISKMVNGTEHSKALSEPLTTQLKLPQGVEEVSVGQSITVKGDLDAMLEDFDLLLKQAEQGLEVKTTENIDASTNNENNEVSNNNSPGNSGGGGYMSEGGLSANPDQDDLNVNVDKINSSTEACSMNVDWENSVVFQQEREVKTSSETGQRTSVGECYNIGQANRIEKDFASTCNIQVNGTESYMKGFIYYAYIDGNRVDLSGCRYDKEDAQPLTVKHDFDSCGLELANVNLAENKFFPAAVKFAIINGTRYNLTECEVIPDLLPKPLPVKTESCDVSHAIDEMTSYTMQRHNIYDPTGKELLKKGECERHKSFRILKDYEAGCTIQFKEKGYIKGFKYYANIQNKRHDISSCEYDEGELKEANILKDFDACSLNNATVHAQEGIYNPAFIKFALVDGKRYDISGCETSVEISEPLPTRTEVCELEHSIPDMKTYRMERVDTYDPANKEMLVQGECYPIEEIAIQRDFDAGCSIQLNASFNTYTRGFKFFSTVDKKKYVLSECEYNESDRVAYDTFKDYSQCDLDHAVIDIEKGIYQPPFTTYTLIDGQRYELGSCELDETDTRELPTKKAECEMKYDHPAMKAHDMERIDIYDPKNKVKVKVGDCYSIQEHEMFSDYDVKDCVDLPDYTAKEIAFGYKNFYIRNKRKHYADECKFDFDNKKPIDNEIATCKATENLTALEATVNKRWFFIKDNGEKEYITDCQASDEKYPIVLTPNTCSPQYIASTGEVIVQKRKGWVDKNGKWHYATNCEPTDQTTTVRKEWCTSPAYEHDFVGGQSYRRSRNYYIYEGKRVYINGCSKDSAGSFPHDKTAQGCQATHDNKRLRSRLFEKTVVKLHDGEHTIRGCTASSHYVPYSSLGNVETPWTGFRGHSYWPQKNYGGYYGEVISPTRGCDYAKSAFPQFKYTKTRGQIQTRDYNCSSCGDDTCCNTSYPIRAFIEHMKYRRFDGSTYQVQTNLICEGAGR